MRVLVVSWLTLAVLLVGGCGAEQVIREAHPAALAGTVWRAVEVNGRPTVAGSEPTAAFKATDVGGSTGCNTWFGSYSYDPSTGDVAVDVTGMSAAACADATRSEIEAAFVRVLASVRSASVDPDGRLLLSGPAGNIRLEVGAVPLATPGR